MLILGGCEFLMSEVPLHQSVCAHRFGAFPRQNGRGGAKGLSLEQEQAQLQARPFHFNITWKNIQCKCLSGILGVGCVFW